MTVSLHCFFPVQLVFFQYNSKNMRDRSVITFSVPRIRQFLRFVLGVLIVSLSITASLLSITLFLLREHFSQSSHDLHDSTTSEEDRFSCKSHGKFFTDLEIQSIKIINIYFFFSFIFNIYWLNYH